MSVRFFLYTSRFGKGTVDWDVESKGIKRSMRLRSPKLLFILAFFCLLARVGKADPLDRTALIGKWDYTSYTAHQKGKPSGTVQFKPGGMVFTYREDGTWEMEADDATRTKLNGSYEVHGTELIMKKADGSLYQDFNVELKDDGKGMILKDKRSIVTASKLGTAP
jgi:hypothetical protein